MKLYLHNQRYLIFSIITFIGLIIYELNINIANLLPNLFANTKSLALLANNDQYLTLNNKTKFIINSDNIIHDFKYMDYDNQMINGQIDLNSINKITLIQGNRAVELSKMGLKTGAIGGFSLMNLIGVSSGEFYFPETIFASFMCGAIDGVALSAVGMGVGSLIPNEESYNISNDEWQFVDIGNYIQNN